MTRPRISAIVQTYNEERNIGLCLKALKDFDEILVVDMESTDRTVEIAKAAGARVIVKERGTHTLVEAYRDFAIHAATHDWVMVVDADEIVPSRLREFLYDEIARDPSPRAYLIPLKNYTFGRWERIYYPNHILRFFNRNGAHWPYEIHSRPSHEGPTIRIPAQRTDLAMLHLANESVAQRVAKINTYTDNEMPRRRASFRAWKLLTDPAFRFFKFYFLKGGWREGWTGFIRSVLEADYRFILLAKLYGERASQSESQMDRDVREAIPANDGFEEPHEPRL